MPFHEKYRKDNDGNVVMDKNNDPVIDREGIDYNKFPANFLADTKEEADKLYKKYLNTLQLLAVKYSRLTGLSQEDFVQEGVIGLARASRDFVGERSKDFNTFAIYKIKDSMREFVSSQGAATRIPQYIKDVINLIERLKRLTSTIEPIGNMSYPEIWHISKKYEHPKKLAKSIYNIRQSISNLAERSCTTVEDLLERAELSPKKSVEIVNVDTSGMSSSDNTLSHIFEKHALELIEKVLNSREFEIFKLHFVENYTIREMQDILGKTDGTIAVQIRRIREKLDKYKYELLADSKTEYVTENDLPYVNPENDIINALDVKQLKNVISEKDYELLINYYIEGRTLKELGEENGISGESVHSRIKKIKKKIEKDVILNAGHKNIEKTGEGNSS